MEKLIKKRKIKNHHMKLSSFSNSLYQVERKNTTLVVGISIGALLFVGFLFGALLIVGLMVGVWCVCCVVKRRESMEKLIKKKEK